MKNHWLQKQCGKDPQSCHNARDGKCEFPSSDCLLFEKLSDDAREYEETDNEESRVGA